MMTIAKRRIARVPRWTIPTFVLIFFLLLLGYGAQQCRQYRYYMTLQQQTEPLVNTLHQLQPLSTNMESGRLLSEQLTSLTLKVSRLADFAEQSPQPLTGSDEVMAALNRYLHNLQTLQDMNIRSRYALKSFGDMVEQQDERSAYAPLLWRSRLYLSAPNLMFLYDLDDEAERLKQTLAGGQQPAVLYYYRLYRESLEDMIRLRQLIADDSLSVLTEHHQGWQQQAEVSRNSALMVLAALLLLSFSLGMGLLAMRNWRLHEASEASFTLARAKTDFLANMSHEIRTPMNAIIGFASLLQQTRLDGQQSEYLNKIKHSSDNLLLLINDILDLTKVEAGKLELEDVEYDLNEQLERLSGLFADMSEQKQLEVVINKAADVPDCLRGDPLRLGQVLVNLVNNAVKFTERGEVVLSVSVCSEPERRLCVEVSDTGIGIMPDQLERLFGSFTQVDASTTRKYGGSGLGLSISRHLVQLMGGTIEVTSQPGRGSTFTVNLPLHPAQSVRGESPPVRFEKKKVLLVDDNALVVEVVSRLLHRLGLVVYSARDMDSAKELLHKRGDELDLALIDCCLGQDNGLELARYLVQQPYFGHISVVIMSAFGRERPAARMRALGIHHYLSKPVTEHSLRQSLIQILGDDRDTDAQAVAAASADLAHYHGLLAGKQILLAEDNRMNQQLIVEFLKQVAVSVTLADNGRQAVELMSRRSFDVILMDLQMPILDGMEATRQIRKLRVRHDIPIVALTASAMRGDREACLQAGMNGYVTKPVHRFDLYQALTQVLLHTAPPATAAALPESLPVPEAGSDGIGDTAEVTAASFASQHLASQHLARPHLASQQAAAGDPHQDFADQHQDDIWLLQAALAGDDWQEAMTVVTELASQAERCGLAELAARAGDLLPSLQQRRRPEPEQLTELTESLVRLQGDIRAS